MRLTIMAAVATLCGSIGLYPLFVSGGWFWTGLGAVMVVSATGALVRRYRLPALINLAGGLAALHVYITLIYASDQALLGIIPTPGSLARVSDLVGAGWRAANSYAAPVPLLPGIAILATLGIGSVAVLVDFLAVRLRRAAPAGLPLLAMYSVPAAIREESISWLAFGIGAGGFLALLLTDAQAQVGGWGRPVFTSRWSEEAPQESLNAGVLSFTGRRIGLTAVAAAIALPAIVPGIQPKGLFGVGGGSGGGGGGSRTVTTLDPLVSLKRELTRTDDAEVLTHRTNDPQPDYLRLYALDRFDGEHWTYSHLPSSSRDRIEDRDLPQAPGLAIPAAAAIASQIAIGDNVDLKFLPLPYPPTRVDIKGDWRVHAPSLMVYSLRDAAGGRRYTVRSLKVNPAAAQLETASEPPTDIYTQFTRVPPSVPDRVREIAENVTHTGKSDYEKAMLLQRWFTNGQFTYSLGAPPPKNVSALLEFLDDSKTGYCEQFAASMALMARELNIPARVAMGYTAGTPNENGEWIVRSRDSHAWPELYFSGIGWVRFEPTPSGAGGQGTATVPQYAAPLAPTGPGASAPPVANGSAAPETSGSPSAAAGQRPQDQIDPGGLGPAPNSGESRFPYGRLALALPALIVLLVPLAARMLTRRRRWALAANNAAPVDATQDDGAVREGDGTAPAGWWPVRRRGARTEMDAARAAWAELRADAIDYRVEWRPAESPRAVARRLAQQLSLDGAAADALSRITTAEERARYAPEPGSADTLRADSRVMRAAFASSVDRWTRIRAKFLPASTVAEFRAAVGRVLEAVDRLDAFAFSPWFLRRSRG